MKRIPALSPQAQEASTLLTNMQSYFASKINYLSETYGENQACQAVEWFRDKGLCGGGVRFEVKDTALFNRGSMNYSQVQYEHDESKKLNSATALSCIIHPNSPHAPSMHMHFSWTQMKDNHGYWRMMADLNPSISNENDKERFSQKLESVAKEYYAQAKEQGDKYFNIATLNRHRGVSHFYLENFHTDDKSKDSTLAKELATAVIDVYIDSIEEHFKENKLITKEDKQAQLAYHTLYLFQVLTLDKGTTSGLLIHNENDVGILASIPSHVDVALLQNFLINMPTPQNELLQNIITALGNGSIVHIDEMMKKKLANVVREHYTTYPHALKMQAQSDIAVPTVNNHK